MIHNEFIILLFKHVCLVVFITFKYHYDNSKKHCPFASNLTYVNSFQLQTNYQKFKYMYVLKLIVVKYIFQTLYKTQKFNQD